jgi:UPF0716 family protein affecting phage T7 exclusion
MESANIARSVKVSRGYFIMAAVLLSLGFFLMTPGFGASSIGLRLLPSPTCWSRSGTLF